MALTRDTVFWSAFTDHAQQTTAAAKLLIEMLEHPDRREALAGEIKELEHQRRPDHPRHGARAAPNLDHAARPRGDPRPDHAPRRRARLHRSRQRPHRAVSDPRGAAGGDRPGQGAARVGRRRSPKPSSMLTDIKDAKPLLAAVRRDQHARARRRPDLPARARAPVQREERPARSHEVARHPRRARDRDRPRRGRREHHRRDRAGARLMTPDAARRSSASRWSSTSSTASTTPRTRSRPWSRRACSRRARPWSGRRSSTSSRSWCSRCTSSAAIAKGIAPEARDAKRDPGARWSAPSCGTCSPGGGACRRRRRTR